MATEITIKAQNLTTGETFIDQFDGNMRAERDGMATQLGLGEYVATRLDPNDPERRFYYYHNGRIDVTTRKNQYTTGQRVGYSPMP